MVVWFLEKSSHVNSYDTGASRMEEQLVWSVERGREKRRDGGITLHKNQSDSFTADTKFPRGKEVFSLATLLCQDRGAHCLTCIKAYKEADDFVDLLYFE